MHGNMNVNIFYHSKPRTPTLIDISDEPAVAIIRVDKYTVIKIAVEHNLSFITPIRGCRY
jgi:hypothetical protein